MADQGMNSGSQSPVAGGVQSYGTDPQISSSGAGNGMPGIPSSVQEAKETAANLAGQARQYAGDMTMRAKDKGRSMFEQQKETAVGQLGSVADALRRTADQLQQGESTQVARYMGMAADQLETFGSRLREKNIDALIDDTQNLARRHPGMFLAGTMAVGFILARFMKSSSERNLALPAPAQSSQFGTVPGTTTASSTASSAASDVGSGSVQHVSGTSTDTAGAMTGDLDISPTGDKNAPLSTGGPSTSQANEGPSTALPRRTNQGGNFYGDR